MVVSDVIDSFSPSESTFQGYLLIDVKARSSASPFNSELSPRIGRIFYQVRTNIDVHKYTFFECILIEYYKIFNGINSCESVNFRRQT